MDNDNLHPVEQLQQFMKALRDPDSGCSWDRAQTLESLTPYTLDETYELLDAVDKKDWENLKEELGDLLFHIVFYAQIAQEKGLFNFSDVAHAINDKIARRYGPILEHPNATPEEVEKLWQEIKAEERKNKPKPVAGPQNMDFGGKAVPALLRAATIAKKAESDNMVIGTTPEKFVQTIHEELEEIQTAYSEAHREEEIGDALLALAALSRFYDIDPERALQKANAKFIRRWQGMHEIASDKQQKLADLDEDTLNAYWNQVKTREKSSV